MSRRAILIAAVTTAMIVVGGCEYPRDPDGTLDRVEDGTLRVGVTVADPWVAVTEPEPTGVEPTLVREFAGRLGAEIEWFEGSEEELVDAMKEDELDLIIGGFTTKSPWKKEVAFTRPYADPKVVVGVSPTAPENFEVGDVPVTAVEGSEEAGLADRKTAARVVRVAEAELAEAEPPIVAHDYEVTGLGLEARDELARSKHVMLAPMGENAFLVRLERFLLDREDAIQRLLEQEGKP